MEGEVLGVDGYIIDLRNNPGGVFEEAIAISSYFLDDTTETPIVETVRTTDVVSKRNIIDTVWKVGMLPSEVFPKHAWSLTSRPVAVLTNRGTASASEVMTGALQVLLVPAHRHRLGWAVGRLGRSIRGAVAVTHSRVESTGYACCCS